MDPEGLGNTGPCCEGIPSSPRLLMYSASVTIHILAAILWLGGMAFIAAILVPLSRRVQPPEAGRKLVREAGVRFRILGWIALGVLVLTGLGNLHFGGRLLDDLFTGEFWASSFGQRFTLKLSLVAAMAVLSFLHDFVFGPRAARAMEQGITREGLHLRRVASWLARLNLLLAVAIVATAVMLVRGWP